MERKRSRLDKWVSMDKPKVGTPFDWEDWEQYAKTRSPMRWRLFGVPSKVLGRLRTWLRRGRHHA